MREGETSRFGLSVGRQGDQEGPWSHSAASWVPRRKATSSASGPLALQCSPRAERRGWGTFPYGSPALGPVTARPNPGAWNSIRVSPWVWGPRHWDCLLLLSQGAGPEVDQPGLEAALRCRVLVSRVAAEAAVPKWQPHPMSPAVGMTQTTGNLLYSHSQGHLYGPTSVTVNTSDVCTTLKHSVWATSAGAEGQAAGGQPGPGGPAASWRTGGVLHTSACPEDVPSLPSRAAFCMLNASARCTCDWCARSASRGSKGLEEKANCICVQHGLVFLKPFFPK